MSMLPLETLYEVSRGDAMPLPPELASVYGCLAFPPRQGRPMSKINEAFDRLASGKAHYRIVLDAYF